MRNKSKYIISGGGTGGHIFPAISIANALKKAEPNCEILFVGALGKMEMERIPKAGYQIIGIPIIGFKRSISFDNLKLPFKIIKGISIAKKIIKDFNPNAVIGVGGYASAPILWSAARLNIPTIIQEQNSYAGLTNKILSRKAKSICVAYENMESFFPKERIILTGNPIRENIKKYGFEHRQEAIQYFNLNPEKKVIFIVGGSLGSLTLNKTIEKWILERRSNDIQLIWQFGKYHKKKSEKFLAENKTDGVRGYDFIDDMDMAYAAADLIISRAGAGTISELAVIAKPTIFVPSPNVTENHQWHNSMALVNKKAALMVEDRDAEEKLIDIAIELVNKPDSLRTLELEIAKFAKPNASKDIVKEIQKHKIR